jgi:uncharacterized damage-inducible protein DinB
VNSNQRATEIVIARISELKEKIAVQEKAYQSKSVLTTLVRLRDVLATNEQFYSWLRDAEDNRLH